MPLSREDVDHVATLARLGLTDTEKARLRDQLDVILDHISRLRTIDTSHVAETAQVGELVNVMRDDVVEPSIGADVAVANSPAGDGAHFVVGAIQDDELDS